jgi:hypothetical protein
MLPASGLLLLLLLLLLKWQLLPCRSLQSWLSCAAVLLSLVFDERIWSTNTLLQLNSDTS